MPQEFAQNSSQENIHEEDVSMNVAQSQEEISDLDAILDDIETVLATNAEECVHGFVQKVGE